MLLCREENCICLHHQLLNCLRKGQNTKAKLILPKLANIEILTDDSGSTLLHYSVKYGNAEMTQHLIDEGCDVNDQDDFGVTPLMLAIKVNDVKAVEILLKSNADIYLANSDDKSSLELVFYLRLDWLNYVSYENTLTIKVMSEMLFDKFNDDFSEMLFDKVNDDFSKGTLAKFLLTTDDSLKLALVVLGNGKLTKVILEKCYSIDIHESKRGRTALHCAILLARFENAKLLLEYGANVDALDRNGCSPIIYYAWNFITISSSTSEYKSMKFEDVDKESEILKSFLRLSTSLSTRTFLGFTDVEYLLSFGKKETVRTILLSGVNVDECIKCDRSLLFLLFENKNFGVFDLLDELDINFDVDKRDKNGKTALMNAARDGFLRKVELLLRHGADVNLNDDSGLSALNHAFYNRSTVHPKKQGDANKIIELLLQHGAVGVQCFFSTKQEFLHTFSHSIEVIAAHLAMLEAVEQSSLTDVSRNIIKSVSQLKTHFNSCSKQLKEMKQREVYGTVTLFKLLTDREEKIIVYARNPQFLDFFSSKMKNVKNWTHFEEYYSNILQRRLELIKLCVKVSRVIEALTGWCNDAHHAIVNRIINYLNRKDLHQLCEINSIF